ncbi:MAG: methionyl-tRNA formyltransferase [Armatimonadetes bacterium]|nr:methionyl-tRNA formyltransferase [Armatimonadota bacterium]MDE2205528.1 methionyl-tRNA formyltransferase [Armatimonadota bacterium]
MANRRLRVLFMGTSEFARPTLERVTAAGHDIAAVVSQPDRPSGRGRRMQPTPVSEAALRLGLPLLRPERVRRRAFLNETQALAPEIILVAAFGQILPQALLDIASIAPVNVHGSLLPALRGAAPIQRALMQGAAETGVTTMWMDAGIDTGDVLMAERAAILPDDDAGSLGARLAELGAALTLKTLDQLAAGTQVRLPQDGRGASYAPKIDAAEQEIGWDRPAGEIINRVRGLSPLPGAWFAFRGTRVRVQRCSHGEIMRSANAGVCVAVNNRDGWADIATADDVVRLWEVQPSSRSAMPAAVWARAAGLRADMAL